MTKSVANLIKDDLIAQLEKLNKTDKHYIDMVNDYVYFFKLKQKLKKDITKNGIRVSYINGNGIMTEKPNESIINLTKINTQMLKILSDLDLQKPHPDSGDGNDLL